MVTLQFDERLLLTPLPQNIPAQKTNNHMVVLQVPAGKSIHQTLKDLDIQLTQAVSALVDGQTTDLKEPLKPGAQVRLLPQIAGGD